MFEILVRPSFEKSPPVGTRFYCEDWQCPALDSCARHFGRSYAYAAMVQWADSEDATAYFTPERAPFADQCQHYEMDRPRKWMRGWCEPLNGSWCCVGCSLPECPRALRKVVPFAPTRIEE